MPTAHAKVLQPSSGKMWLTCPPSARLNQRLKERFGDKGSVYAEEGTKAHSVGELKLSKETGEINDFVYNAKRKTLGDIPPEMDRATDYYVDIVLEKLYSARHTCPDAKLYIEKRLHMDKWAPQCFGTGDAIIVSDSILEVCDLKYGKGVPVSAIGNAQARLYGLGAIDAFGSLYGFDTVRNTIIQPRLDSVTEETMTKQELLDWGEEIRPIAETAYEGKGEFKPGEHCRFCAARAICYARAAEAMHIFEAGLSPVGVISDEDISRILPVLDEAEKWIKDIRAYALNQAIQGQEWPGYILSHGKRPNRQWTSEEAAIEQLTRAGIPKEEYMKTTLRSVTEIEKLLGRSTFNAVMGGMVYQGEGKLELAPENSGRIPVASADATFADMAGGDNAIQT